jgi:polysaccharide deacetylase 2 family uncharacterized protein YibQ
VTADELSAPLGRAPPPRKRRRTPFSLLQLLATLAALVLLTFAGFALFGRDPMGGEPMVRLAINPESPSAVLPGKPPAPADAPAAAAAVAANPAPPPASAAAPPRDPPAAAAGQRTVTIIDGSSGARTEIVVSDKADPAEATPAAASAPGINPALLEKSRYGMVPIMAGGMKPFAAYAEGDEALRARAMTMPVVAIVVGGLGIGAAKTADAIVKLPAAITLAFTPYGADPAKLVERARAQRHEVLLQVPMEPFDYPDNDPGPQTLLTTLDGDQNLDRLAWHMSRLQGYVGLTTFMGARFVATNAALLPIVRDAARRGLGLFDDGRAPRSLIGSLAEAHAVPFARASLTIDEEPTPAEIDRALGALEAQAKERGVAIGMASALPVSIERLSAWSKQLQNRGILLVPLTTAMLKSKPG